MLLKNHPRYEGFTQNELPFPLSAMYYFCSQRQQYASEIYARHLGEAAPEPINIDSSARNQVKDNLAEAPLDIFDVAKNQVISVSKVVRQPVYT